VNSMLIVGARIPQPSAIVASWSRAPDDAVRWRPRQGCHQGEGVMAPCCGQVAAPACGPRLRSMPRGVRLAIADSRLY
jgi:hypothetical protein